MTANQSYAVHKDVLSDLLHRYHQVKRIRAHGAMGLGWGLAPDERLAVYYSVGLCFPRLAVAWKWFTALLAVPSTCCHQECAWEEAFKVRALTPTSTCQQHTAVRPLTMYGSGAAIPSPHNLHSACAAIPYAHNLRSALAPAYASVRHSRRAPACTHSNWCARAKTRRPPRCPHSSSS